jgi:hypothetical protein
MDISATKMTKFTLCQRDPRRRNLVLHDEFTPGTGLEPTAGLELNQEGIYAIPDQMRPQIGFRPGDKVR